MTEPILTDIKCPKCEEFVDAIKCGPTIRGNVYFWRLKCAECKWISDVHHDSPREVELAYKLKQSQIQLKECQLKSFPPAITKDDVDISTRLTDENMFVFHPDYLQASHGFHYAFYPSDPQEYNSWRVHFYNEEEDEHTELLKNCYYSEEAMKEAVIIDNLKPCPKCNVNSQIIKKCREDLWTVYCNSCGVVEVTAETRQKAIDKWKNNKVE